MPKMRVTLGIGYSNCKKEDVLDIDEYGEAMDCL